jgi:hypothetical protein
MMNHPERLSRNRNRSTARPAIVIAVVFLSLSLLAPILVSARSEIVTKDNTEIRYFSGTDYEIGQQKAEYYINLAGEWDSHAQSVFEGPNGAALKLALEFRLTELGERYPGLIEEWQGIADAAGISINSVALEMMGERVLRSIAGLSLPDVVESLDQDDGCSAFGMTHSDRGPILGKTSDRHGTPTDTRVYQDDYLTVIDHSDGYRVMMFGYALLNDQGLAVGDANAHYFDTTDTGIGRGQYLAEIIPRYCHNVDSAVAFIENYEITDDGRHLCFVDQSGKAAIVEKGPGDLMNVRWGDSTGYVYVTNTSPDTLMRVHDRSVAYDSAYTANSDHRLANFERMFTDTAFQFTFAGAESIIYSHDTLGAICQHGDSIEGQWHTDRSRLVLPSEGKIYASSRVDAGTSYHPCEYAWRIFEFLPLAHDEEPLIALPLRSQLNQNYPNPFNAQTTLAYRLVTSDHIEIAVYNLLGDRVKVLHKGIQPNGEHELIWDGTDEAGRAVASGLYYYRLEASDIILTKRMTLLK